MKVKMVIIDTRTKTLTIVRESDCKRDIVNVYRNVTTSSMWRIMALINSKQLKLDSYRNKFVSWYKPPYVF